MCLVFSSNFVDIVLKTQYSPIEADFNLSISVTLLINIIYQEPSIHATILWTLHPYKKYGASIIYN